MLELVFKDLGSRFPGENDLSDLTWAIAKNCKSFLHALLDFFGFQFYADLPLDIFREYALDDNSRPDLVVENGNLIFIIESKIYDRYYHLEQYAKAPVPEGKTKAGLAIITNHRMDEHSFRIAREHNFKVSTWTDFSSFVENKLQGMEIDNQSEICVRAYVGYVKEVCSIMEPKEIRFNTLSSLFQFNRLIKKIIEEFHREGFDYKLSKQSRANGENWAGHYFSLKRKNGKQTIYPFYGIYYGEDPPTIYFAFEKDWCKDIYLKFKGKTKDTDFYYIESSDWEVSFCLNENKFEEFTKAAFGDQEKILIQFFNRVVDEIGQYL